MDIINNEIANIKNPYLLMNIKIEIKIKNKPKTFLFLEENKIPSIHNNKPNIVDTITGTIFGLVSKEITVNISNTKIP